MTKNAIDRSEPAQEAVLSRRRSGTRLIHQDEPVSEAPDTAPTLRPDPWRAEVDQDSLPTQPQNEAPVRRELAVDLAPPSHDETRDTIPSPPPDAE